MLWKGNLDMSKTWLILDVSYMAHRAFHTMGVLSHKDVKTGVVYGFLRSVQELKDRFGTDRVVFCFDSISSKRKEIYPEYKKRRHTKELTPLEIAARNEMRRQVKLLRTEYLPKIGYKNVLMVDGFESDDLMAATVLRILKTFENDEAVIVTADRDLWQCIGPRVVCYNPDTQKQMNCREFMKNHNGLDPSLYWKILALSGCKTDEVKGIPTIGKVTALQFLSGTLKDTSKKYAAIQSPEGLEIRKRNKKLVRLPWPETPMPVLHEDHLSKEGWHSVCDALGLKSIRDRSLYSTRELRRNRSNLGLK